MIKLKFYKILPGLSLLLLGWLLYWGESWEARLNMDGMTYGALAKHILSTGDWTTLHYSSQAYSNYFQHPPLMMWMTALIFKLLGATEWSAKILPFLFGLGSVVAVTLWGKLLRSEFCGFLAGFILLTSTRYIKYSANLLLDGPLGFWMICGGLIIWLSANGFIQKLQTKRLAGSALGICMAAAFLTKGLPSLVLPFLLGLVGVFLALSSAPALKKFLGVAIPSLLICSFLLTLWLFFGDGFHYLQNYWDQSAKNRLNEGTFLSYLAPTRNLFKGYWPWLPFYGIGVGSFLFHLRFPLKKLCNTLLLEGLPFLFSILILMGFSISGFFLEHYLVPFYPFAALVVAQTLEKLLRPHAQTIYRGLFALIVIYAQILATIPLHIQADDYKDPQRVLLKRASVECLNSKTHDVTRIYISDQTTGIWWGLALGLWNTPWDAVVIHPNSLPATAENSLLLIETSTPLPAGWKASDLREGDYQIAQKKEDQFCNPSISK